MKIRTQYLRHNRVFQLILIKFQSLAANTLCVKNATFVTPRVSDSLTLSIQNGQNDPDFNSEHIKWKFSFKILGLYFSVFPVYLNMC